MKDKCKCGEQLLVIGWMKLMCNKCKTYYHADKAEWFRWVCGKNNYADYLDQLEKAG